MVIQDMEDQGVDTEAAQDIDIDTAIDTTGVDTAR